MKIALLQRNFTVGDLSGNAARLEQAVRMAAGEGAELCVASELAITGYPPLDLLRDREFLGAAPGGAWPPGHGPQWGCRRCCWGFPEEEDAPVSLYDAAALLRDGHVEMVYRKRLLGREHGLDGFRYYPPRPRGRRWWR